MINAAEGLVYTSKGCAVILMPDAVVFEVGEEKYQLPQSSVLRILRFWEYCRDWSAVSEGVDGMIKYRGQPVKVVDVRRHAGVEQTVPNYDTRIILLDRKTGLIGLLVDRVITGKRQETWSSRRSVG